MQPIEMVWAQVKQKVRMQSHRQRTAVQLQQQTKIALRSMDSDALTKIIGRVHKDIDEWLRTEDAGWLQAWKSFELLRQSTPEQRDIKYKKAMGVYIDEFAAADENENPVQYFLCGLRGRVTEK